MDGYHYDVAYFDALQGGSGLVRIKCEKLHEWLKEHPGFLIRELRPIYPLAARNP